MKFQIKNYIAQNGERYSFLFSPDDPGVPLFYPAVYVSRQLRDNHTHQSQLVALDGIRRLNEWERDRGISLEERLLAGTLLNAHEVDDLAGHMKIRRSGKPGESICSRKFNVYWGCVRCYIAWLTDQLILNANKAEVRKLVEKQDSRLKAKNLKRVGSRARKKQALLDEKFSEPARQTLLELFSSPFLGMRTATHSGTRLRNVVMARILYETGMRRGELLSLKLKNFVESSGGHLPYLEIERNHDDELDHRTQQPVAKTQGRILAISSGLEDQIKQYRTEYRAEIQSVGFGDEDFLFCAHQFGRTVGQALTVNGFNSAISYLKKTFPSLGKSLHPHAFRHDFNYRFSLHADEMEWTEAQEAEAREEVNGWCHGSEMAKVYNLRHRREKAMEIGVKIARDTERPL